MTVAIADAPTDLTPDENSQAHRERPSRRGTLRQPEPVLEEDDEICGPGEPVETTEQARDDRGDGRTIPEDRAVQLEHAALADVHLRGPQLKEEERRRSDREQADERQ